jgi:hypothetical protein
LLFLFVFYSVFRDGFSDLSTNGLSTSVVELEAVASDLPANHMSDTQQPANINSQQQQQQQEQQQLNLMTPDAFSSPAKKDSPTDLRSPQVSSVQCFPNCYGYSKIQKVTRGWTCSLNACRIFVGKTSWKMVTRKMEKEMGG